MPLRTVLNSFVRRRMRAVGAWVVGAAAVLAAAGRALPAQDGPARRLSSIVGVAVEEYGKALDKNGRMVSDLEYQEAVDFLGDARQVAARLSGDRSQAARDALDSLIAAVGEKRPPKDVVALHAVFTEALGSEGRLELPSRAVDLVAGRALYAQNCASCHGATGLGDGPLAKGMNPAPPALGHRETMRDVTPALMFRVVSVGIAGTAMAAYGDRLTAEQRWDVVSYVNSLRATPAEVLQGEGLYLQRCAACHGAAGAADGVFARSLTRLPPEIGTLAWQAERSDAAIEEVVRAGIPGTAMPSSRDIADPELASVVAYVRTLPSRAQSVVATGAQAGGGGGGGRASSGSQAESAPRAVLALLDQSLGAARAGRSDDAADRAFDAYIAFEPLETSARAKSPGLVAGMERHFADFKGAVKRGDLRAAEGSRNAIEAGLPAVVALTRATTGGWGAFIQSFLIIFREGLEAILVIGAVVAFLIKTGNRDRLRSIWIGVGAALLASAATAVVLKTILAALPATREIIEGVTMLVAVGVLFSVSYWLISKVEAAKWQQFIKEKVGNALQHGGGKALALVAFLAVYREGAETALFYQALFAEGPGAGLPISLGILVGFAVLAVVFTLFYRYGVRIPLRPFFAVTSALLYYMAFVFMGKGVRELQEGNVVSITVLPGFPHVDALGLFPSVETLLAQMVLLVLLAFALVKTFWPKRSVTLPTMPPPPKLNPVTPDVAERLAVLQQRLEELTAKVKELEGERAVTGAGD